jgi:type IV pilus assembly protein PilM
MAKPTGVWGIDLGQCALKAIRLELIDGRPTATAFDVIEHPKILSQPDADPDVLIRESLEKFFERNKITTDQIAISISGQSGLARFVKLPPVEEKKIPEIVKFEAKQQIPFPLDEVVWAYQKIAGGEKVGAFTMDTEIGMFAMKRDIISRQLGHYQAVNAEVHYVQMTALALCNFATYEVLQKGGPDEQALAAAAAENPAQDDTPPGKKRCAVVLDIGTDSSNLIITDGAKIIWQRPVPLGGNNFTRALTKELKITFAKAEHLKRNAAKSPELATILKALRPVLTDFVGEVQRSLGYFTNTHRDAHVSYMVGLGSAFKLPGLQKYLSEKLSLEVRKPARMERLAGDAVLNDPNFLDNILTFPVAYGLALQGLTSLSGENYARLTTNLLPQEIHVERMIRAKKPWAAAAAAALLIGVAGISFGYGAKYGAVNNPDIKKTLESTKGIVSQADQQASQQTTKKGEIDNSIKDVAAIISGNEERLNWLRLYEAISAALPRPARYDDKGNEIPGTTNLELPEQRFFWQDTNAKRNQRRAFELHLTRLAQGVPLEKLLDEDLSEHLAMVNIESIDARYTDNLQGFLTNAAAYAQKESGIDITQDLLPAIEFGGKTLPAEKEEVDKKWIPKAPEGAGWVIELRGYTYNSDATKFLKSCLVKNLQPQRLPSLLVKDPTSPSGYRSVIDNSKVNKFIPDAVNPLEEKISHVFLCISDAPDPKRVTTSFRYIGNSKLDLLVGAPAAAAGDPMGSPAAGMPLEMGSSNPDGGGAPGAGAATGGGFKPLIRGSAGAAGQGGPGGLGSGRGGPTMPGLGGDGVGGGDPDDRGGGSGYGASGPAVNMNGKISTKIPHEFIIYFIWREPTKS